MKYSALLRFLMAAFLCTSSAKAQLVIGTKGMFIKSGTHISLDSLLMAPSSDYSFVSNSLTRSYSPVSGTGVPSISRVHSFSTALTGYYGKIGTSFINSELNGNYGPWLAMIYTADNVSWKVSGINICFGNNIITGGTGISGDTLKSITAVNNVSFYSKSSGDLASLSTWGSNVDGSGVAPENFNNAINTFVISNRTGNVSLGSDWSVNGTLWIRSGTNLLIDAHTLAVRDIRCLGTIGGNRSSMLQIKGAAGNLHIAPDANVFGSLILDSNASATLVDTLKMAGAVTLNYSAMLGTSDKLVLLSDSLGTARVGSSLGTIFGNVSCMQYIPGGRRAYRFWSHPFSSYIPLSQIENYIDISGLGGNSNGFTSTASNAPSCYWYHTSLGNSTLASDPGWKPFNSCYAIADTDKFKRYEGIRLYFRGIKGQGLGIVIPPPSPAQIGMYGPLNQGEQPVYLSKGADTTKDYNMIGNPYASPVDIGTVINNAKQAGLIRGAAFYVWNPYRGSAGGFEAKTIGSPFSLQAYNCFQVRAAVNGALLDFNESNKTTTAAESLFRQEQQYIALQVYDTAYHPWDITYLNFTNDGTEAEDDNLDAGKLSNFDMNFYTLSSDHQRLSIDARPYKAGGIIPIGFYSNYAQKYIIKADQMVLPEGGRLVLHDKYMNKFIPLELGTEYGFEVTADTASQGNERFELRVGEKESEVEALSLNVAPNPASDEISISYANSQKVNAAIRVVDMAGVCVLNKELGVAPNGIVKMNLSKVPAGIYLVEIAAGGQKTSTKIVKE